MPASMPFYNMLNISSKCLGRTEKVILEAELYFFICNELELILVEQYEVIENLNICVMKRMNVMLEHNFVSLVIKDILSTNEYTLSGVALYTLTPIEILEDILLGFNLNPSASLLRKVIELHRSIRPQVYCAIIRKFSEKIQNEFFGENAPSSHQRGVHIDLSDIRKPSPCFKDLPKI